MKCPLEWSIYFIRILNNNYIYTGITKNMDKRFLLHKTGKGAKCLRNKNIKIIYNSPYEYTHTEALKLEKRLKKLSKYKKEILMNILLDKNK